jgi:hypothetical protein
VQPARTAPRDPDETLDGFYATVFRLVSLGATIRYSELPHDVVLYDGTSGTVHFKNDAALEDLAWAASHTWQFLANGPHASAAVPLERHLYAVPADA